MVLNSLRKAVTCRSQRMERGGGPIARNAEVIADRDRGQGVPGVVAPQERERHDRPVGERESGAPHRGGRDLGGPQVRLGVVEGVAPDRHRAAPVHLPEKWIVGGYQADMDGDNKYTGILYEERGRGILAQRGERLTIDRDGTKSTVQFGEAAQLALQVTPIFNSPFCEPGRNNNGGTHPLTMTLL